MDNIKQAQKEYEELVQWVLDEEDRVVKKMKAEGRYVGGLDTNAADLAYIYKERNRRIKEIKEKYGID